MMTMTIAASTTKEEAVEAKRQVHDEIIEEEDPAACTLRNIPASRKPNEKQLIRVQSRERNNVWCEEKIQM
jgi:hypothetical protein